MERDIQGEPRAQRTVLATIVRVGNDEYARQNQSYGLTTLQDDHVREDGRVLRLEFRGKGGKMHSVRVNDRRLKRIIRSVQDLPGQDLFQYLDADANRQKITSRDINDYLQEISGQPFTDEC